MNNNYDNYNCYDSDEVKKCRQLYKEYVNKLKPREFAESIIKEGSTNFRYNIIKKILEQNQIILNENSLFCDEIKKYEENKLINDSNNEIIELFLKQKNLSLETNFDINKYNYDKKTRLYYDFIIFCEENDFKFTNGKTIHPLPKYVFIDYLKEKERIKNKIDNLSDLDCALMKLSHIG
jgi:hypothetical protein